MYQSTLYKTNKNITILSTHYPVRTEELSSSKTLMKSTYMCMKIQGHTMMDNKHKNEYLSPRNIINDTVAVFYGDTYGKHSIAYKLIKLLCYTLELL